MQIKIIIEYLTNATTIFIITTKVSTLGTIADAAIRIRKAWAAGNAQIICTKVYQIGAIWHYNMRKYRCFSTKNVVKIVKKQSFLSVIWLKNGVFGLE